ncbi:hypothetical protein A3C91_02555 [Candidatus Azambacteria bacterium RIFCSPHIGHO2_02_FULL_52_12]|uniref:Phospholipase C/D domain-containing protein n=1 Tax=Candidatus Azambacteria bacterium RIFCSPLOWO2_01_FULL_46_25 TaxID=1797298 RepID=A0A1F5BVR4_9BACT|nr:MAG: hypothetical protein A3C91_02555 [Candidatus Azambacteria bacterium RIFCSPHIGHO2_02_FULL_52_12]OGD34699.1 MAG: hypothetical protein A2988_04350 [Candidatus Azambacteria bacterium RIFCSPLOWO2_01_FULL_46_25]OGD37469.1 MAG: hypothetical protein A2850_02780 [Candidatus Azambacteria bacterium RIFCSPHIGHO2_01_FULL_51_74]
MDIFAHGLWAGAGYKALNRKYGTKLNVKIAAFWGIFPDIFAFSIPLTWMTVQLLLGNIQTSDFSHHPAVGEPPAQDTLWIFALANSLYSISHSAVVFFAVFFGVWFILKRPVWELGGWLLHILIDVPTHTYQFFPTPVFWPLSGITFSGIAWSEPWFMFLNYGMLLVMYLFLMRKKKTA